MSAHVLITRTNPGASRLAEKLQAIGVSSMICPMLEVESIGGKAEMGEDIVGFILTSAAAIIGLPTPDDVGVRPIYCVGAATAAQAKQAGYQNNIQGSGNGRNLARQVLKTNKNQSGVLLWCRGEIADEAMGKALRKKGIKVQQHRCYRTKALQNLPVPVAASLEAGQFNAVIFQSRQGADSFRKLKPNLSETTQALAFSAPIAARLADMGFANIITCERPNEQSMIAALKKMFSLS